MSFANPGPLDTTQPPKPAPAQNGEVPEFPSRSGIAGTFLGGDFKGSGTQQGNAYVYDELLTKIGNHITPRSNVFAVYLTVGFFEVMDDTVRPVKLGAEIRARNGIPIRHKMFAIIDRTNIGVTDPAVDVTGGLKQGGKDTFVIGGNTVLKEKRQFFMTAERVESTTSPQMVSSSVTQEFCPPPASVPVVLTVLGGMSNPMYYDGQQIDLPPTFTLYADVGTKQETLTGCSLLPTGQISVPNGFRLTHAAGFTLSYLRPANPGPQPDFSYDGDAYKQVIPYTVIIQ